MLDGWAGRRVPALLISEQPGFRTIRCAPASTIIARAADHHPAMEFAAEAVTVIRTHKEEIATIGKKVRPDGTAHMCDPLPGSAAIKRTIDEAVRVRRSMTEIGVRHHVASID